jgi:hypothetical protein
MMLLPKINLTVREQSAAASWLAGWTFARAIKQMIDRIRWRK